MKKLFAAFLLAVTLSGCAGFGSSPVLPQTQREIVASAEIAFTNAVDEVGHEVRVGNITPDKIDQLRPFAIAARQALDAAQSAIATGQPADSAIAALQSALRQLELQIAKAKGK